MDETPIPQLVAHRGYMHSYPENTWTGLRAALQAGAPWLEFDIQMCRDGNFVLLHDDNFARTAGIDQSVFALDSERLTLSVHEPVRFGEQFAPVPVSTLTDVLQHLADWPSARAMVEIKQESIDRWGLETVMERLVPLLEAHRAQCVLIGYNRQALAFSRRHSAVPVGWVLQSYDTPHREQAEILAPDYLICNYKKIPPENTPWSGPWQWMLYDIVDAAQAIDWAARGVALVETADVGAMLLDARLQQRALQHGAL